jgi:hypothetical protein
MSLGPVTEFPEDDDFLEVSLKDLPEVSVDRPELDDEEDDSSKDQSQSSIVLPEVSKSTTQSTSVSGVGKPSQVEVPAPVLPPPVQLTPQTSTVPIVVSVPKKSQFLPSRFAKKSGTSSTPNRPQAVEDDEFKSIDADSRSAGLNGPQIKYMTSNSLANMAVDLCVQEFGLTALGVMLFTLKDKTKQDSFVALMRLFSENEADTLKVWDSRIVDDEYVHPKNLPTITPEMVSLKAASEATGDLPNLSTYAVSPSKFNRLENDVITLVHHDPTDPIIEPPEMVIDSGGAKKVHYSPATNMSMLLGYLSVKSRGKSESRPHITTDEFSAFGRTLVQFGARGIQSAAVYGKLKDAVKNAYLITNSSKTKFGKIKPFDPPVFLNKYLDSAAHGTLSSVIAINARMEDLASFSGPTPLPFVSFTPKMLGDARIFRNDVCIGQIGKDPLDLYSLKTRGVSVIKKFFPAIMDAFPIASHFVATGHSKTNNWESLLNRFGIHLLAGNILEYGPNDLKKDQYAYDATIDFPWGTKYVPVPPGEGSEGEEDPFFEMDRSNQSYAHGCYSQYLDGVKYHQSLANGAKTPVLISDVYVPLTEAQIKTRDESLNIPKDVVTTVLPEYLRLLKQFVSKGWLVIAKFPMKKTDYTSADVVWDLDAYLPAHFGRCYIKPYLSGRMHNGEIILAISKDHIVSGQKQYGSIDHFKTLSRVFQTRMAWGNALRNYLLCLGIHAVDYVPESSKMAMQFATDSMKKYWLKTLSKAGTTVAPNSFDDLEKAQAKHLEEQRERKKKQEQLKAEKKEAQGPVVSLHARAVSKAQSSGSVGTSQTNIKKITKSMFK